MIAIRAIEYLLLVVSLASLSLSVLLLADGFRDVIAQGMGSNPDGQIIAASNMRSVSYGFLVKLLFLYVAVSFVTSPIPSPLPTGTGERVLGFTLGALVLLIHSVDAYLTKRRLLQR